MRKSLIFCIYCGLIGFSSKGAVRCDNILIKHPRNTGICIIYTAYLFTIVYSIHNIIQIINTLK